MSQPTCPCCGRIVPYGTLWVRPGSKFVWIDDLWIPVRPIGADLLYVLVKAGGGPVSRETLIDRVYGSNPPEPNTVHVHVSALRREFRKHLGRQVIGTNYGYGFHIEGLPRLREIGGAAN